MQSAPVVLAALCAAGASARLHHGAPAFPLTATSSAVDALHNLLLPPPGAAHPSQRARYASTMSRWGMGMRSASGVVSIGGDEFGDGSPAVFPVDFGADPTGTRDSTAAFASMMSSVLSRGTPGGKMAENITDLGGVTVDMQGGVYLLTAPIVIPINYGNIRFTGGTLRAHGWSDPTRFIVEVGDSTCKNGQSSCNMNIGFSGMLFDSNVEAAGSIKTTATMGANVGPLTYHLGFLKAGVEIEGGHEVMVHESWFGEFYWGDPRKENSTLLADSSSILINGNDHFVLDTISFSSTVGVMLNGEANLLQGVHTWNCATAHGGRGVVTTVTQNRFEGIYMDFTDFTVVDATGTVVSDSFFLGGGRVELVPGSHAVIASLDLRDNTFWDPFGLSNGATIIVNTTSPWSSGKSFSSVTDASVSGTMIQPGSIFRPLAPRVTRTVKVTQATTRVEIDFAPHMPFSVAEAPIQSVQYSISADGSSFPNSAARFNGTSLVVAIEASEAFTGSVTVTADQSKHTVDA